jgi:hypothetical protein
MTRSIEPAGDEPPEPDRSASEETTSEAERDEQAAPDTGPASDTTLSSTAVPLIEELRRRFHAVNKRVADMVRQEYAEETGGTPPAPRGTRKPAQRKPTAKRAAKPKRKHRPKRSSMDTKRTKARAKITKGRISKASKAARKKRPK